MTGVLKTRFSSLLLALLASTTSVSAQTVFENQSEIGRKLRIPVHRWFDKEESSKAIIVALPGLVFTGRAYEVVSRELVNRGYEVYSPDMRGYGDWTTAEKGEFNGDALIHFGQTKEDLTNMLKDLRAANPDKPIFCMGESFGANMAVWEASDHPELVDGVIAVSLPYKMRLNPRARWILTFVQGLPHPMKPLDLTPYLIPTLSNDKTVSTAAIADNEIAHKEMNVADLIKARMTMRRAMAHVGDIRKDCPVLVLAGQQDGIQKTETLPTVLAAMGSHQAKLVVLQRKGHLLLERKSLEPKVLSEVNTWLDAETDKYQEVNSTLSVLDRTSMRRASRPTTVTD